MCIRDRPRSAALGPVAPHPAARMWRPRQKYEIANQKMTKEMLANVGQKMTQKMLANTAHAPTQRTHAQTRPKDHWVSLGRFEIMAQMHVCSKQMHLLFAKCALRYTNAPITVYVGYGNPLFLRRGWLRALQLQ
eukprot:14944657-Alexandrium_andersonii.AAC.1